MEILTPGATAVTAAEAVTDADLVLLALPLGKHRAVPTGPLAGKLVIDAMNYWWEVDGDRPELTRPAPVLLRAGPGPLAGARVVKAVNHMVITISKRAPAPRERPAARPSASPATTPTIAPPSRTSSTSLGFEPVVVGRLADGVRLRPGTEAFGANVQADELRAIVDRFPDPDMSGSESGELLLK